MMETLSLQESHRRVSHLTELLTDAAGALQSAIERESEYGVNWKEAYSQLAVSVTELLRLVRPEWSEELDESDAPVDEFVDAWIREVSSG